MSYYDDDEDLDVHVRHRGHSPRPVRYVQSPPRPRFFDAPAGPNFLVPDQHTTVVARSRSRSRSRSRDRRASPPYAAPAPANPVIINNRIYNENSSDEDDDRHYRQQLARRRRDVDSRSRSRSRDRSSYMTREEWEAEQARQELERLRISNARDKDERRRAREYRDELELQRAKRELDDIKSREARAKEEERIKKELELKRLREEEAEAEEKKRREDEAAEAVERYKRAEQERIAKDRKRREESEREYKMRLHEDLLKSGLDDKAIAAIINKEKVPRAIEGTAKVPAGRPTFTRMARRHLSIETLRTFQVEFDFDADPDYILVKRWVPEWEQDELWRHTKHIREKRGKLLMIEEKKHHRHEPEFEWVRKKDRRRSKSPSVLTYLAGGRPS